MIIQHMYQNPASQIAAAGGDPSQLDEKKVQEEFDDFYEEVFDELAKHGEIEELNVCENLGDHMVGNVYVKYADEEFTNEALQGLWGRFYAGRPLVCEFSPVTDFREARCRQYDEAVCTRGGYCNFMHIRTPSRSLRKELERRWHKKWRKEREARERAERGEDVQEEVEKRREDDQDENGDRAKRSRRDEDGDRKRSRRDDEEDDEQRRRRRREDEDDRRRRDDDGYERRRREDDGYERRRREDDEYDRRRRREYDDERQPRRRDDDRPPAREEYPPPPREDRREADFANRE